MFLSIDVAAFQPSASVKEDSAWQLRSPPEFPTDVQHSDFELTIWASTHIINCAVNCPGSEARADGRSQSAHIRILTSESAGLRQKSPHIAAAFIASAVALAIAMALTLVGVLTGNVER